MARKVIVIVLLALLHVNRCEAEGFLAGTLVKTCDRYVKIEDVSVGDYVVCFDNEKNLVESIVTYVEKKSVTQYVHVSIGDGCVNVASDQQFYNVYNDSWIAASCLQSCDVLTACKNDLCVTVELVDESLDVYVVGVAKYHNFFVTTHDVCVHNFLPPLIVGVAVAFGSGTIEIASISAGIAGLGTFLGYQWHKKNKQKHNVVMQPQFYGNGMMPEDPEEEKKKRDETRAEYKSLTNKEARSKAGQLGYRETKNHPCGYTHDKPVFTNGQQFISPDKYGHKGGVWKVFDKSGVRMATVNIDLTVIIGK